MLSLIQFSEKYSLKHKKVSAMLTKIKLQKMKIKKCKFRAFALFTDFYTLSNICILSIAEFE